MKDPLSRSWESFGRRLWSSHQTPAQLVRYGVVGIISNLGGYLIYLLATYLGATPKVTMTVLYGIGAGIGFLGNWKITFAHQGSVADAGLKYVLTHLMGYGLNFTILAVFVDWLAYPHQVVQGVAVFVVAGFLFVTFKLFVFKRQQTGVAIR